jgi:fluoride exporter
MLIACLLVAGAIGAPARYLLDGFVSARVRPGFPWGTFAVNTSGAFVLGVVTGLVRYQGLGPLPQAALGTGFCGAYTTFSTFSYETVRLLEDGDLGPAAANALGSLALGLAAAGLGLALTTLL